MGSRNWGPGRAPFDRPCEYPAVTPSEDLHPPYRWVLFSGVCGVYFAFGVVAMSVPPLVGEVRADLGLTPGNDGRSVRLSFPELTEERRRDLVRMVNGMAEDGKNRMRGLRRHARKDLGDLEGSVSEDDLKWAGGRLDDMIHGYEAEIDAARQAKEDELLEV